MTGAGFDVRAEPSATKAAPNLRGRLAAGLAAACAAVHVPLVAAHWSHHPLLTLTMAALAIACLGCVPHLWTAPAQRTWVVCGALAGAMLAAHLWLLTSVPSNGPHPPHGHPGHDHNVHHGTTLARTEHRLGALTLATTGLTALQVLVAASGLLAIRRPPRRS